jgi:hypothetical protein
MPLHENLRERRGLPQRKVDEVGKSDEAFQLVSSTDLYGGTWTILHYLMTIAVNG